MDPYVAVLVVLGGAAWLYLRILDTRRRHQAMLRGHCEQVAEERGQDFSLIIQKRWLYPEVKATVGDFLVSARSLEPRGLGHVELVIDGQGAIPRDLTLAAETLVTSALRARLVSGAGDIELDHLSFDQEALVTGDEATAVALLDHSTRERVLQQVVRRSAALADGRLRTKTTVEDFGSDLSVLLDLAARLVLREPIPARLARNATSEPVTSVRLRNLTLLQEKFPDSPEAVAASRHALTSPNLNLQLAGAMHLGEEGLEVVHQIALARYAEDYLRISAVQHLANPAFAEQTIPILETLLSSPEPGVRRAAIEGLGRLQHAPARSRLEALASLDDPRTLEAVAEALQRIGDRASEPCLVHLVQCPHDRVRLAAVRALGHMGTVEAIEPLLELAESAGRRRGLRREARKAIARIQARLGDVEAGRLTLATTTEHEGGLSLAADPEQRGALSLETETEEEADS